MSSGDTRAGIAAAAERCERECLAAPHTPWSWFDLGISRLHLAGACASLACFAKGIDSAPQAWMLLAARSRIGRLLDRGVALPGLELLDELLRLGWWTRASEVERERSPWPALRGAPPCFASPVLLLAGGCDGIGVEQRAQLARLRDALRSFSGTIVSGGTRSGVAELAGDLQENSRSRRLTTIGYLPAHPGGARRDERYSVLRETSSSGFSPLEPLAFWRDYLASGHEPSRVRLVGFNGGPIAACEYRMALALGARVGIVAGSGRSADALLSDPAWRQHERLRSLKLSGRGPEDFLDEPSPDGSTG